MKTEYIYEICDSSRAWDPHVPLGYFLSESSARAALSGIPENSPLLDFDPENHSDDRKLMIKRRRTGLNGSSDVIMIRRWVKQFHIASGTYSWK